MITLFQDKILFRKIKEENKSIIELPENTNSFDPIKAEVLQTGPSSVSIKIEMNSDNTMKDFKVKGHCKSLLKAGDKVLIEVNKDYPIKINGEWLFIVKEKDVIGFLDELHD